MTKAQIKKHCDRLMNTTPFKIGSIVKIEGLDNMKFVISRLYINKDNNVYNPEYNDLLYDYILTADLLSVDNHNCLNTDSVNTVLLKQTLISK